MLEIYSVALDVCRRIAPLASHIERQDRDLARQLRRAMMSVPLNVAEGQYSKGGNRRLRFSTALGSSQETLACLEVALAVGYLADLDPELLDQLDRVARTLSKLAGHKA